MAGTRGKDFEDLKSVTMIDWFSFFYIYPTPPLEQDITQGQFLSEV